jgi:hypothetical protein
MTPELCEVSNLIILRVVSIVNAVLLNFNICVFSIIFFVNLFKFFLINNPQCQSNILKKIVFNKKNLNRISKTSFEICLWQLTEFFSNLLVEYSDRHTLAVGFL